MKDYKDDQYIYDALDLIDLDDLNGVYKEEEKGDSELIKLKVMEKINVNGKVEEGEAKKKVYFRWKKPVMAAAFALVIATSVFMGGEISSANRIHENTSVEAYGMEINKEALEKYSTDVNKIVTDRGVNLNIKNVLIDGNVIWINYEIYSEKYNFTTGVWPKEMDGLEFNIKVNGKEVTIREGQSADIKNKNTFKFTQSMELTDIDIKGNVDVEISTNQIGNDKGEWKANFTVDAKDIVSETKEYKVGKIFVFDKVLYRIKSIVINPIQTTLYYSSFGKSDSMLLLDMLNEHNEEIWMTGGEEHGKFFMKSGKIKYSSAKVKGDTLKLVVQKTKGLETGESVKDGKSKEIEIKINKAE